MFSESERIALELLHACDQARDYRAALLVSEGLIDLYRVTGRFADALELLEGKGRDWLRASGFGPWMQMSNDAQRLQILSLAGKHEQVLDEVSKLCGRMDDTASAFDKDRDPAFPSAVRERVLDAGEFSNKQLKRWEAALELNEKILAAQRARNVVPLQLARTQGSAFEIYLALGRFEEAERLLSASMMAWEQAESRDGLSALYQRKAELASTRGQRTVAIEHARAALDVAYETEDREAVACAHHNLACYLPAESAEEQRLVIGHRLAAVVLFRAMESCFLNEVLAELAADVQRWGQHGVPQTLSDLLDVVDRRNLRTLIGVGPSSEDDIFTLVLESVGLPSAAAAQPLTRDPSGSLAR